MNSDVVFLMPVFNAAIDDLKRSLRSMESQSYACDVLIVDDGSSIPVSDLVEMSPHIHILRLPKNSGITEALNAGLRYIRSGNWHYVARMDAGDVCNTSRIELQRNYMLAHREVSLLGCLAEVVNPSGETLFAEGVSGGAASIANKLFDNSAFKHPTFFFEAKLVDEVGFYSRLYPNAEDYEFMRRVASKGSLACLDQQLLTYVRDESGLSLRRRRQQLASRLSVQIKYFSVAEWRSYVGIARTLATFLIPVDMAARLSKLYWGRA